MYEKPKILIVDDKPQNLFALENVLSELKILPLQLAEKLAPFTGLRNRLVHEYDLLDHSIILETVKDVENLYPEYIKAIEDYVSCRD